MNDNQIVSRLQPQVVIPVFFLTTGGVTVTTTGLVLQKQCSHCWWGIFVIIVGCLTILSGIVTVLTFYCRMRRSRGKVGVVPTSSSTHVRVRSHSDIALQPLANPEIYEQTPDNDSDKNSKT